MPQTSFTNRASFIRWISHQASFLLFAAPGRRASAHTTVGITAAHRVGLTTPNFWMGAASGAGEQEDGGGVGDAPQRDGHPLGRPRTVDPLRQASVQPPGALPLRGL